MATKEGDMGNTGKQNDLIHADNQADTGQEDTEASISSKLPSPCTHKEEKDLTSLITNYILTSYKQCDKVRKTSSHFPWCK
jgi:hypothetical protein